MATINHTVSVSMEFHELAEKMHLSWTEASRRGMVMMLAEAGVEKYENEITRLALFQEQQAIIKQASARIADMQNKIFELETKK